MYNANPIIQVPHDLDAVWGYEDVITKIKDQLEILCSHRITLAIETYPGVTETSVEKIVKDLGATYVLKSQVIFQDREIIMDKLAPDITDDRILGRRTLYSFEDFICKDKLTSIQEDIQSQDGLTVIWGSGASLLGCHDLLIYVDITRWEVQLRYRTEEYGNWLANNEKDDPTRKIKQGYFVDWVMADKLRNDLLKKMDLYIDLNDDLKPKMVRGQDLLVALEATSKKAFRLKPFFDAGVWGGSWMQDTFKVETQKVNLAWCFDGVPEENSILLNFGGVILETPASNLIQAQPKNILGNRVYGRFGANFPIRFDYLDTLGGQNLSLQVHPMTDYIQDVFGMPYTQDESYYIMYAEEDTHVYAGVVKDIDKEQMIEDLYAAQDGKIHFPADKYINQIKVKKHDHISYPGGTIHCSGEGMVVLEISSTPNRFTFKLWDWGRVDFDGLPRPINLEHGLKNVQFDRDEDYVRTELYNQIEVLDEGDGYKIERTGLHDLEFIETIRRIFTRPIIHKAKNSCRMVCLVEGDGIIVESVDGSWESLHINYGETFIVPDVVGDYRVRPAQEGVKCITVEATVR